MFGRTIGREQFPRRYSTLLSEIWPGTFKLSDIRAPTALPSRLPMAKVFSTIPCLSPAELWPQFYPAGRVARDVDRNPKDCLGGAPSGGFSSGSSTTQVYVQRFHLPNLFASQLGLH